MNKSVKKSTSGSAQEGILRLYKSREMAAKWGITYNALRELVLSGKIRPFKGIGKSWLFDGTEINEVLERL
jgi:predicted site-specific integrase-resolvase